MPKPKQEIHFSIQTVEDMQFNKHRHEYFALLDTLLSAGFSLAFYRNEEKLTTIKDKSHLENFKKSFPYAQ